MEVIPTARYTKAHNLSLGKRFTYQPRFCIIPASTSTFPAARLCAARCRTGSDQGPLLWPRA